MHHHQAGGLADDAAELVEETDHDELDLAIRSYDHTEDDEGDVAEGLEGWRGDAHGPGCDEHGDGSGCLCFASDGVPFSKLCHSSSLTLSI